MKYVFLFFTLFNCLLSGIFADSSKDIIKTVIKKMSAEEKAAQVLFLGIDGKKEFPQYLSSYYNGLIPGAVILFKYNISDTAKKTAEYIQSVKDGFKKIWKGGVYIPALFSFDCEGGSVYRLRPFGSKLPAAKTIARDFSPEEAERIYTFTAEQISLLGVHFNLAPVIEAENSENIGFLGTRVYSDKPEIVEQYASAFIKGLEKYKIAAAVKHFPANGNADPHVSVSVVHTDKKKFYEKYVLPFKKVTDKHDCAVLISHAKIPVIENVPFCFSKKGIQGLLREQLGFKGLVITDDISMGALKTDGRTVEENAILALTAGCDMVMCTENRFSVLVEAIAKKINEDKNFASIIENAVYTILKTKIKTGILDSNLKHVETYVFDDEQFNKAKLAANKIVNAKKN